MTGTKSEATLKTDLSGLLIRGRERAGALNHPVLVSLTEPLLAEIDHLELFALGKGKSSYRALWVRPDRDFWLVGWGRAVALTAGGTSAMTGVMAEHKALLETAVTEGPDVSGVGPVFRGGFRYDTRAARDPIWQNYPDALLLLPRFLFTRSEGVGWLTVNTMVDAGTDTETRAESLMEELQAIKTGLPEREGQPEINYLAGDTREEWSGRVRSALKVIDGGLLTKVVLSRRKELRASGPFSPESALKQLSKSYPECSIFAYENKGDCFIGASPESIAFVQGSTLNVACLAGSAARGSNPADDNLQQARLLENQKERREHRAAANLVADTLKDVCRELHRDNEPRIMKLKNIQHIFTSFRGSLRPGISILDVVKRLHPTPAVAGVPTDRALEYIREIEGDRGWYAAPVGWVDANGGGEFVIGIRSALLRGDRAYLNAGCGIVAGSDPESEYREAEMKFQPLLTALGCSDAI